MPSSKYPQVFSEPNQDRAFEIIKNLDITTRQKASLRFRWKKKHNPGNIRSCPAKGKRSEQRPANDTRPPTKKDHTLKRIDSIKEQIAQLQTKLDQLIKSAGLEVSGQDTPTPTSTRTSAVSETPSSPPIRIISKTITPSTPVQEGMCTVCGHDPEGYDLPCRHDICHRCFREKLVDTKISCPVCNREYIYDMELED